MSRYCLILGFFDGVHKGHKTVIDSAVSFAKENNTQTILITFKNSPAEFFQNKIEYIYPRELSYKIIKNSEVNTIIEKNFSTLVNMEAEEYLKNLIKDFNPISISTGFNHTFGYNREGNPELLNKKQTEYGYKYFCIPACYIGNEIVSSTVIKKYIKKGDLAKVNSMLGEPYIIESKVVHGAKLGRRLGFPTANLIYPKECIKLPYGVYLVKTPLGNGVLNWGIKPTIGGEKESLEVHIPGFSENIYGQNLKIKVIKKIRDEQKFNSLDDLKKQIKRDTEECLKL